MRVHAVIFDVYATLLEVGPPPADADAQWQNLFQEMLGTDPPMRRVEFSVQASKVITRHHEQARARGILWPEVHWPSVVTEILPSLRELATGEQEEFFFRQMQTSHTTWVSRDTAVALRGLRESSRVLGIASNAQAYTIRELEAGLRLHGLGLNLFERDLCFWSFQQGFSKPDPHVFQILSARLTARSIQGDRILMVGDRIDNDVDPARFHGWQAWQIVPFPKGDGRNSGDWKQLQRFLPISG
jgi:FMN phosphatase YigB (HAD superfamily)